jgi:hypothetical protein
MFATWAALVSFTMSHVPRQTTRIDGFLSPLASQSPASSGK